MYVCTPVDVKSQAKAKVGMNNLDPSGKDKGYCAVTEAARLKAKNAVCLIKAS